MGAENGPAASMSEWMAGHEQVLANIRSTNPRGLLLERRAILPLRHTKSLLNQILSVSSKPFHF